MGIVWGVYFYLNFTSNQAIVKFLIVGISVVGYRIFDVVVKRIEKIELYVNDSTIGGKKFFILSTVFSFAYFMVWYIAFFPGIFTQDSLTQFSQAISGTYSDWHPVCNTLIFYTLPYALTGSAASIVLFQIIYFSLILGYMSYVIGKYVGAKPAIISLLYIILNPYSDSIVLRPLKDVGFAMFGLLSMVIAFQIYFSEDEWSKKTWRCILFGIVIALTTLFRHNAVLFTAPMVIALFFNMKRKNWIKLVITVVMALILVKGPVYYLLNVEKPGNRVVETVGLPLTVIGNVAKETPELMDDELAEYAYAVATQEQWEQYYICGNFNSIKWKGINTSIVEEKGCLYAVKLTLKCFKLSPEASLNAVFSLTDMVYGIDTGLEGNVEAKLTGYYPGTEYYNSGNQVLRIILRGYSALVNYSILKYLRTYGVVLIAVIICVISKMKWKSWKSWKKMFLFLPLFSYDFGTMLLLTGDDSRFFYITFLLCPLLILSAIYEKREKPDV
jgi:hypothetical protein